MSKHYIYEIFGKKIGATNDVARRMKEQNAKEGEYRIIEEHTNAKVASQREMELQREFNYPVDRIAYWKTLRWQKKALTKKAQKKRVANTDYKTTRVKGATNTDYKAFQQKRITNTNFKLSRIKAVNNTNWEVKAQNTKKPVNQYDLNGNFLKKWDSAKDAGDTLGFQRASITNCCREKLKTAHKFKWKYAN
jgi:hypothetical protein